MIVNSETATIVKMIDTLPQHIQVRVIEHLREYITDINEELRWEASYRESSHRLEECARKAKEEIADGKAIPLDIDRL